MNDDEVDNYAKTILGLQPSSPINSEDAVLPYEIDDSAPKCSWITVAPSEFHLTSFKEQRTAQYFHKEKMFKVKKNPNLMPKGLTTINSFQNLSSNEKSKNSPS